MAKSKSKISKPRLEELEELARRSPAPEKRDRWTEEEEEILVEYVGRITQTALASYFGRTPSSVENKIKRLRLDGRLPDAQES